MNTNAETKKLSCSTSFKPYTVTRPLVAIQNTTSDDLHLKLGGGDGVIVVPPGGYFEPYKSFLNSFEYKAIAAGDACLVF